MKRVLSTLLSVIMIVSVSACGSQKAPTGSTENQQSKSIETTKLDNTNKEPIKLKVLLQSEDPNRQKLYQDYYSKNASKDLPGYDIEFELPGKAYTEKLKIYNSSGELPDVFWGMDIVCQAGNALDLTPYIQKDGFLDKYKNKAAVMVYKDGKIYAINSGTDSYYTCAMYYHKDIFTKENIAVPKSFDDLVDACTKLQSKGYVPISAMSWAIQNWLFQDLMTNVNPDDLKNIEQGSIKLTDKPFVDAADKVRKLADIKAFPKDVATIEMQPHVDLFNQGKAAMIYHPLWLLSSLTDNKDLDYFLIPSFDKTSKVMNIWGSAYNGFTVSKNSKNTDAAVKTAEWLALQDAKYFSEVAKNIVAIGGYPIADDINPIVKACYDQINDNNVEKMVNFTSNYLNEAAAAELDTNTGKLLTGQITGEEFAKAMDKVYSR